MLKAVRILSSVSESALVYAVRNVLTMPAGESSCWLADFIAQTTHQVYVDGNGFFWMGENRGGGLAPICTNFPIKKITLGWL